MNSNTAEERSKVKVVADAFGNVVTPSKKNPAWGHIRVEQTRIIIDDRNFAHKRQVSALIQGQVKDLRTFGWKKDQELNGTIIFKEQLKPFNIHDPERDYKKAGKTNIVCCIDGQPIYRKTSYNHNPNAQDVFIRDEHGVILVHTNSDEIRLAYEQEAEGFLSFEEIHTLTLNS